MRLRRKNTTRKLIRQRKLSGLRIIREEENETKLKVQAGKNV